MQLDAHPDFSQQVGAFMGLLDPLYKSALINLSKGKAGGWFSWMGQSPFVLNPAHAYSSAALILETKHLYRTACEDVKKATAMRAVDSAKGQEELSKLLRDAPYLRARLGIYAHALLVHNEREWHDALSLPIPQKAS